MGGKGEVENRELWGGPLEMLDHLNALNLEVGFPILQSPLLHFA